MIRQYVLLFFSVALCMFKPVAQPPTNKSNMLTSIPPNNIGEMTNITDGKSRPISYKRDQNANENKTKYTIYKDGIELYEVSFISFINNDGDDIDSVSIRFDDKQKDKLERKNVKFYPEDSKNIVASKRGDNILNKNDITIDQRKENYDLLFSIDDKKTMFITLYQFKEIEGTQTYFSLQPPVADSVKERHSLAVERYIRIMNDRAKHKLMVSLLKRKMVDYKDGIIQKIKEKEVFNEINSAPIKPELKLQEKFNEKVDPVFRTYLKTIYPFYDYDIAVRFIFSCYGNKKLDPTKMEPRSLNGNPIDWFKDTFNKKIRPDILAMEYATIDGEVNHAELKEDFINHFKDEMKKLAPDDTEFADTITLVSSELSDYLTRKINVPTLYTYDIKYTSKVEEATWRLQGNGDIKPKDHPELVAELKEKFIEKTANKAGKYDFQICTISINDKIMGRDIKLLPKKETLNY